MKRFNSYSTAFQTKERAAKSFLDKDLNKKQTNHKLNKNDGDKENRCRSRKFLMQHTEALWKGEGGATVKKRVSNAAHSIHSSRDRINPFRSNENNSYTHR